MASARAWPGAGDLDRQVLAELAALPNLGPASARMLVQAGVRSLAQLREMGALNAYVLVCESGQRPSLNLLWALAGCLENCHWSALPDRLRGQLLLELDRRQASAGPLLD